jgi:fructose-1,6-bisphosphatase/inositol monophosphatase family enzyme
MHIDSIAALLEPVRTAGAMALREQRRMGFSDRRFKADESVITIVDPMVENCLVEEIERKFPKANILAEENMRRFNPDKPYTFALDPIDGTDAFSQSMAGWCISLGLLNQALEPIAGIIFAPKLDLLLFADVKKVATLNNERVTVAQRNEPLSAKSNLMVTSSIHRQLDLRQFPGKVRSIGSAALHLAGPVIYPGVFAAIDGGTGYIWDIAAAHAIVLSVGLRFEAFSGNEVKYNSMVKGSRVGELILAGSEARISALRACIKTIEPNGS